MTLINYYKIKIQVYCCCSFRTLIIYF